MAKAGNSVPLSSLLGYDRSLLGYDPSLLWMVRADQAISADKFAKRSYSNLRKAGLKNSEQFKMLVGRAVWAYRARKTPKRGNKDWCSGAGMSARSLSRLPQRVQRLAHDIERLNLNPVTKPVIWFWDDSDKKLLGSWFDRLPQLLRYYADCVGRHSKAMGREMNRQKKRSVTPRGKALDALMQLVRVETGRDRHTDLSNILTATAGIAGVQHDFGPDMFKARAAWNRKRLSQRQDAPPKPTPR